jgi:CBS domain containing-hemolysin-like protein
MGSWWIDLVAIAVLLIASGLFSGTETALLSLPKVKREAMATRNDRQDRAVLALLAEPRRLIVTIILCNELVNIAISTVASGLGSRTLHHFGLHQAVWVTVITAAVTVPLLVFLGDMTPKSLALRAAEQWARLMARPLTVLTWVIAPLRVVVRLVSDAIINLLGGRAPKPHEGLREAEFRALVDVGEQEGEVELAERRLIHNVFEFGDRTVAEVMTKGDKVFTLPYEMPLGRLVEAVAAARFSRVPIVRSLPQKGPVPAKEKIGPRGKPTRIEEVVGVLYAKDLVGYARGHLEGHTIQDLLRPSFFVPLSTKCERLFREFQKRKTHIALVVDEYGRLVGVVTMEDLLEELFGEIVDEKEVRV